jgi:hypothetical protein
MKLITEAETENKRERALTAGKPLEELLLCMFYGVDFGACISHIEHIHGKLFSRN